MFRFFESWLEPTAIDPLPPPVNSTRALSRFYWHFMRQAGGQLVALLGAASLGALLDVMIPVFIGHVVALITARGRAVLDAWPQLLGMVCFLLLRPLVRLAFGLVEAQTIAAGLTNLIRWQNHWHVVRQGWSYFQNDFAGRIANRVIQTGPALRESVVASINAVWYIIIYGGSAIVILAHADWRLALSIAAWFLAYVAELYYFVPQLRKRSRAIAEAQSRLTGRVVDSYTNILTVKLFARTRDEDAFVREAVDEHTVIFRHQLRMLTMFGVALAATNVVMIIGTGTAAILLYVQGFITIATVAASLPLAWQIANVAGWVMQNVTSIFENVGTVQDGMRSIAVAWQHPDAPAAVPLVVSEGAICFEHLSFGYATARGVLHDLSLNIRPGERVGLVGHSGAGKSTLVHLLLGFYAPEAGRILIDGQDIAVVTQESLRDAIAMVTQDTSLLHRSIRDNIRYSRPDAGEDDIRRAAELAEAAGFIVTLEDWQGRLGYDAQVGERGVKLSGGQRQRIALARVILKNAPILVLDEATSALDSEAEAAIQSQFERLMEGHTVIAIAHRLSTIAKMDRLVVMEHGRIVEEGSHRDLLRLGGTYARLWHHQSGGLVQSDSPL